MIVKNVDGQIPMAALARLLFEAEDRWNRSGDAGHAAQQYFVGMIHALRDLCALAGVPVPTRYYGIDEFFGPGGPGVM